MSIIFSDFRPVQAYVMGTLRYYKCRFPNDHPLPPTGYTCIIKTKGSHVVKGENQIIEKRQETGNLADNYQFLLLNHDQQKVARRSDA